jgi:hypothetical protein
MRISTILEKIDENQLFVPAFQREYVWKRDDAKQLIDSLIKDYPTGTMLTWETANPPELKGPHQYHPSQGAVKLLLDGQQRVTTLYMLIRGEIPPYYSQAEIADDTRGLYVNLDTLELSYFMKLRMENQPLWQNITDIFLRKVRARDVIRALEGRGETVDRDREDRIDDNTRRIENIVSRDFPEQTIPVRATIREAIDIFYKVNASGVALTDAELTLAQISGYWPQARDMFKAKLHGLEKSGFVFKLDFIVYALLGCLHHMGSDMRRLHGEENREEIKRAWNLLDRQVLDYVINLLRTHAYVDHTYEINSPYALVPIIVYCFDKQGALLTDAEIRKVVKWFYYSQIRARYTSQLPQKLDRDLRILTVSKQPFDDLLLVIAEESRLEILPSEFVGRAIQHPLFSMMRWYLKSRDAVCLTTGMSLRQHMGKQYSLQLDSIFPYSRLKNVGYDKDNRLKYTLAQEFTNRAIVREVPDRATHDVDPADYLASVKKRFPNALELQLIPQVPELWKIENYEQFLDERRHMLAKGLNAFLDRITATEETQTPISLVELIAEGESDELEFKSSLRWDVNESVVNKNLEDMVTKTVAAFANSNGGTLLIGVADNGAILGLSADYLAMGGANRDKFELSLRNLLHHTFGAAFVSTRVQIRFHEVDGQDLCQVDVTPAREPIIIKVRDKGGQQIEKFFVRSGNSTMPIPVGEMASYIANHFR